MKIILFFFAMIILMISGCQSISDYEYHDITDSNSKYAVKGDDGLWRGPIKSEHKKEGVRDHSLTEMPVSLNFLNGMSF